MAERIPPEILKEVRQNFLLGEERQFKCCQPPKQKLYVKLKADGQTVLGHCFHCGTNYMSRLHKPKRVAKVAKVKRRYEPPPTDLVHTTRDWPALGKMWIHASGVTEEELVTHGIGYSPSTEAIVFPVHGGWQERVLVGPQKYLTHRYKDIYFHLRNGPTCVIVEDVLSAIRVGRYASAHALMGLHIRDCTPLIEYDRFVVWLDNDNAQVVAAVKKIEDRLSQWATVTVISDTDDPKKQTEEGLWQSIKPAI